MEQKRKNEPCKICNEPTKVRFGINLNEVAVCERCACLIFLQQAKYFSDKHQLENVRPGKKGVHY